MSESPSIARRARRGLLAVLRAPSGVGGAFLGLALFQMGPGENRLAGILVGWLYGISVWGLMRLLPIPPSRAWLAGIFAGPIPIALLMPADTPAAERGVILLGAVAGGLLGLLESAHARRTPPVAPAATVLRPVEEPGAEP